MNEERKLAELLPVVFERESYPIIVGGSQSRVDLVRRTVPSEGTLAD